MDGVSAVLNAKVWLGFWAMIATIVDSCNLQFHSLSVRPPICSIPCRHTGAITQALGSSDIGHICIFFDGSGGQGRGARHHVC